MIIAGLVLVAATTFFEGQGLTDPAGFSFQARQEAREDADYRNGRRALDNGKWDEAIRAFDASASKKGGSADAALYWKAYAQNRAGRREDAMATIAALRREHAGSRWLNDAQALEVEMRAQSGAAPNPAAESDDDLKMLALNSLMQSDPERAFPILQKVLTGSGSPKLKEKALFVLTQSSSPQARKLIGDIARGSSNPELQTRAIRYLGMMGNDDARKELASLYTSISDKEIKRAILRSFMVSGSRSFLLNAAKSESDPDLRRDAIRQLGITGGQNELAQLYQSENNVEAKREILHSIAIGGGAERLLEVARTEKDPALKATAVKAMGITGGKVGGDALVGIYKADPNPEVRKAVLQALFLKQDGKSLVDLARAENDPAMKREIVSKMALVHSKETTDYMMEVLNK